MSLERLPEALYLEVSESVESSSGVGGDEIFFVVDCHKICNLCDPTECR